MNAPDPSLSAWLLVALLLALAVVAWLLPRTRGWHGLGAGLVSLLAVVGLVATAWSALSPVSEDDLFDAASRRRPRLRRTGTGQRPAPGCPDVGRARS